MTIGFGMVSPVLNQPRNRWYQDRNHIRIPKRGESKWYLDAKYTKQPPSGANTPPVNTFHPSIGAPHNNPGVTYTVAPGSWSGTLPISYSYQWQINGVDIAGATATTFKPATPVAFGDTIRCKVTATNVAGSAFDFTGVRTAAFEPIPGFDHVVYVKQDTVNANLYGYLLTNSIGLLNPLTFSGVTINTLVGASPAATGFTRIVFAGNVQVPGVATIRLAFAVNSGNLAWNAGNTRYQAANQSLNNLFINSVGVSLGFNMTAV